MWEVRGFSSGRKTPKRRKKEKIKTMSVDWAKLVEQGRAKAIGVPWSEEELKAIYQLKIPPEYVRRGILTIEDYQKELEKEKQEEKTGTEKPLSKMTKKELIAKLKEFGVEIADENAVVKAELKEMLEQKLKKAEKGRK